MDTVNIGFAGTGGIAKSHARGLADNPHARMIAAADVNEEAVQSFAAEHDVPQVESDYQAVLDNPAVDAVIICLPHALHGPAAIAAAQAGKHVLCEKPLGVTVTECDAIIAASRAAGVNLMVGHTHRFILEHMRALELLREGAIGDVLHIYDSILAPNRNKDMNWRGVTKLSGGGVFMDNGVHSADRLRWWIGAEVTAVTARLGHYGARTDAEDYGVAYLEFANGATATMEISLIAPPPMGKCTAVVTGAAGAMEIATWRHLKVATAEAADWETETFPQNRSQFIREDGEFVASILEERAPLVTGEDGKRAVAIVQAIYAASESGECVLLDNLN
jgi:predicted dehydrogenase